MAGQIRLQRLERLRYLDVHVTRQAGGNSPRLCCVSSSSSEQPATITAVSPGNTTINSSSWETTDPSGTYSPIGSALPAQVTAGCGDERGTMIREYRAGIVY